MRLEGGGPEYIKVGRVIRYRRGAHDAWIASKAKVE
jgi:hypothetical protein